MTDDEALLMVDVLDELTIAPGSTHYLVCQSYKKPRIESFQW